MKVDSVVTLPLPRLVAGRDLAERMVEAFSRQEGQIEGARVVVDASGVLSGTASFASALVKGLLVDERAAHVDLIGGPTDFTEYANQGAHDLEVASRFSSAPLPTA